MVKQEVYIKLQIRLEGGYKIVKSIKTTLDGPISGSSFTALENALIGLKRDLKNCAKLDQKSLKKQ